MANNIVLNHHLDKPLPTVDFESHLQGDRVTDRIKFFYSMFGVKTSFTIFLAVIFDIYNVSIISDPDNPCSEGWSMGSTNCYYVSSREDPTELLTWKDAVDKCKYMDDGSSLLTMRDDEKVKCICFGHQI